MNLAEQQKLLAEMGQGGDDDRVPAKVQNRIEASFETILVNSFSRAKKFYTSPKLRQFWGDDQHEIESWEELFFDLIYVGMAFKLGDVVKDAIEKADGAQFFFFFAGQYAPMYAIWFERTAFLSCFKENSYFHSFMSILTALLVAFMALFIGTEDQIFEGVGLLESGEYENGIVDIKYNTLLGFAACHFTLQVLGLFRFLEMGIITSHFGTQDNLEYNLFLRQQKALRNTARIQAFRQVLTAIMSGGAVVLALNAKVIGSTSLIFGSLGISFVFETIRRFFFSKRVELIPVNFGFMIKRIGEFMMLMLGEGVLQIIILEINEDFFAQHLVLFGLSFLILSITQFMAFTLVPYEAHEHAFTKSALGSLMLNFIYPVSGAALIVIGVALKLVLEKQEDLQGEDGRKFRQLTITGLVVTNVLLIAQSMINKGYYEIFRRDAHHGKHDSSWNNFNTPRVVFSFFYLFFPLVFEGVAFVDVSPIAFLVLIITVQFLIAGFGRMEQAFFGECEEDMMHRVSRMLPEMTSMAMGKDGDVRNKLAQSTNARGDSKEIDPIAKHFLESIRQRTYLISRDLNQMQNPASEGGDVEAKNLLDNLDVLAALTDMLKNNLVGKFQKKNRLSVLLNDHVEALRNPETAQQDDNPIQRPERKRRKRRKRGGASTVAASVESPQAQQQQPHESSRSRPLPPIENRPTSQNTDLDQTMSVLESQTTKDI